MGTNSMSADGSVKAAPLFPNAKLYDLMACSPLVVWYGFSLMQQVPGIAHEIAGLMTTRPMMLAAIDVLSKLAAFLFAAVLIFMLVARRPAAAKARGIFPRAAAFFGCYLGVAILVLPRHDIGWEIKMLSTLLILGGMGFALWGLLWLGRSISIMSEARQLVVGGPYAIVRHPLYAGEQTALIGVALQYLSPIAVGLLLLQFVFQLCRMRFEEEILTEAFPEYAEYAKRTWRLIPGIY